jgi:hypothetical protein
MAISAGLATSYKQQVFNGEHHLADTYKIALYTSAATLSSTTTVYTTTGEVSGTGYTAGGQSLVNVALATAAPAVGFTCDDITWPAASITARGAMIYNATNGNKCVCVIDFGSDRTSTDGAFVADINNAAGIFVWN